MNLRCLFGFHDWINGRMASIESREVVSKHKRRWPSFFNRKCLRCDRTEMWAVKVEQHAAEIKAKTHDMGGHS